jgi:putative DNA primase/helicase
MQTGQVDRLSDMRRAVADIKARVSLKSAIERVTPLRRAGKDWKGCCPFHNDTNPSFYLFLDTDGNERYHCFSCGESGDIITWTMAQAGLTYLEAVQTLASGDLAVLENGGGEIAKRDVEKEKAEGAARPVEVVMPVPDDAEPVIPQSLLSFSNPWTTFLIRPNGDSGRPRTRLQASAIYTYRDTSGRLLGHVLRVEKRRGGKLTPTVVWGKSEIGTGWHMTAFPDSRPLYGLDRLAQATDEASVLLVEGEKAADAAARMVRDDPGSVAMTWPGGTGAVDHVDWSPLRGRRVTIWPDADWVGHKAAARIVRALEPLGAVASVVLYEPQDPDVVCEEDKDGWDLADAEVIGWTREQVEAAVADHAIPGARFAAEVEDEITRREKEKKVAWEAERARPRGEPGSDGSDGGAAPVDGGGPTAGPAGHGGAGPPASGAGPVDSVDLEERCEAEAILRDRHGLVFDDDLPIPDYSSFMTELIAAIRGDAQMLWDPGVIAILSQIRETDSVSWTRFMAAIRSHRALSLTDIKTVIDDHKRRAKRAENDNGEGGDGGGNDGEGNGAWGAHDGGVRVLGYYRGTYYYLSPLSKEIVALRAQDHKSQQLLQLCPLEYWRDRYWHESRDVDWLAATSDLMQRAHARGVFDGDLIRGRGAWIDKSRIVFHLGDRLVVDGEEVGIEDYEGDYYYQIDRAFEKPVLDDPLSDAEGRDIVDICRMLRWANPVAGDLLAGFIALGPICGALPWRPHIWLTGGSGSGKSWVMSHVVKPLMETTAKFCVSTSTEAGIRAALELDARPILFDEAESEDNRAQVRIQQVLELMRQASSETGGDILKSSKDQRQKNFKIRSCFALGSISVSLKQQADISRVAVLELETPPGKDDHAGRTAAEAHFRDLQARVERTMTPEASKRLLGRMIQLLPVIRKNASVFSSAAARYFGSQRAGDQYGLLLAGAFALTSSDVIDFDGATAVLRAQDDAAGGSAWDEFTASAEHDADRCLSRVLTHQARVESGAGTVTVAVGELIEAVVRGEPILEGQVPPGVASRALTRMGLKVNTGTGMLHVANNHDYLSRIYEGSPWAVGWNRIMVRCPGAIKTPKTDAFGTYSRSRSVQVPLAYIFADTAEDRNAPPPDGGPGAPPDGGPDGGPGGGSDGGESEGGLSEGGDRAAGGTVPTSVEPVPEIERPAAAAAEPADQTDAARTEDPVIVGSDDAEPLAFLLDPAAYEPETDPLGVDGVPEDIRRVLSRRSSPCDGDHCRGQTGVVSLTSFARPVPSTHRVDGGPPDRPPARAQSSPPHPPLARGRREAEADLPIPSDPDPGPDWDAYAPGALVRAVTLQRGAPF